MNLNAPFKFDTGLLQFYNLVTYMLDAVQCTLLYIGRARIVATNLF